MKEQCSLYRKKTAYLLEIHNLFRNFVTMMNFRQLAYCTIGFMICVFTLFIACSVLPDTAELHSYAVGKSPITNDQHQFNAADKAMSFAVESPQEISVPTSSSVRMLRIPASRILPGLHQHLCCTLAKSASFFNSRHLRLYEVAAPFACTKLKEYFIYALRRIII